MPAGEYHYPREVLDFIHDYLTDNMGLVGLKYVGYGDEDLIPEYPAVVVSAGPKQRILLGTHKFQVIFQIDLWVQHANLSVSHKQRTREDMELCENIQDLLDANANLSNNIVFGYIESEAPGIINRQKGAAVVSTRMVWTGESRQSFP